MMPLCDGYLLKVLLRRSSKDLHMPHTISMAYGRPFMAIDFYGSFISMAPGRPSMVPWCDGYFLRATTEKVFHGYSRCVLFSCIYNAIQ